MAVTKKMGKDGYLDMRDLCAEYSNAAASKVWIQAFILKNILIRL
jgi:hypothetical protein